MKIVLITGGSSGIGFEISTYFAKENYKTLWVSLLEEELQASKKKLQALIPSVEIDYLTIDLSQTEAAETTYNWVQSNNWTVDVLINNAGFGTYGFANDIAMDKEVAMIQLNVLTVFKMTRFFLKDMMARDAGTIINISSNTSFQAVPKMAAYASTKAFVKHYSQSLMEELVHLQSKVKVITICPAAIKDTKFKVAANMTKVKTFEGLAYTTKEEVAKDIWTAFQNGQTFMISGARMRAIRVLQSLVPYRLNQFFLRKELEEK